MTRLATRKLALAVLICGAVTVPAFSPSAGAAGAGTETFEGECEMSGTSAQVTVLPDTSHEPCYVFAETNSRWDESLSVTVASLAVSGPRLVTVIA